MDRVPRPEQDYDSLPCCHYKPVFDSSNKRHSGETRYPDDFQPRKNLKVEFANNRISATDLECITTKFIVKENLVHEYLEHLQNMQRIKGKKTVQEANGKNPEQDRRHMMTMNGGNK
jgi:hypothetical protein